MTLRIGTCEFEHLMMVDYQPFQSSQDIRETLVCTDDVREILRTNASTFFDGEDVIACVGIAPMWKGVGNAWALLSKRVIAHPLFLTRSVLALLDYAEQTYSYRRIEAAVAIDHAAAHRWIRHLGFSFEGIMTQYGLGGTGDFARYARTC
jgi:hypothetical protein